MRRSAILILVVLLLSTVACTEASEPAPTRETVAYKLAVIDGDPGKEPAFQRVIDCIMASGIEGAETEERVGDVLVASWQEAGQPGTLLEWAQAFC